MRFTTHTLIHTQIHTYTHTHTNTHTNTHTHTRTYIYIYIYIYESAYVVNRMALHVLIKWKNCLLQKNIVVVHQTLKSTEIAAEMAILILFTLIPLIIILMQLHIVHKPYSWHTKRLTVASYYLFIYLFTIKDRTYNQKQVR